jgi:3-oxoacyl-[acyl-carrier protein] reductase
VSDRYLEFTQSSFGRALSGLLGLPQPPRLTRADAAWAERPFEGQGVLLAAAPGSAWGAALLTVLDRGGARLRIDPQHPGLAALKPAAQTGQVALQSEPEPGDTEPASKAIVFDASGLESADALRLLYDLFHVRAPRLPAGGRIVLIGRSPAHADGVGARTAAAALRGFVRSLAKEVGRKGSTVNLLEVAPGGEKHLDAPLRFLLSAHSAFITGQSLAIGADASRALALPGSLDGKVALVTGAARGIGAAIAQVLAREGAKVIGLDHPAQEGALGETLAALGGQGLALDVTAADAASRIRAEVGRQFGGLDLIVHNAGVTRDKMIRNMPPHFWDLVININLAAILRINEGLLEEGLNPGARAVCISSIGGIAGNAGQTNYAATKAGVIGYVQAMAPVFAARGGAINAVAPGFIETQMTAEMPVGPREVGRRLSALSQGGVPQDIAEAVAFFGSPAAQGINGSTLRVCGQNFVGA